MGKQKLTLFLLKDSVKTIGDALRTHLDIIPVNAILGANAGLVLKAQPEPKEPGWKSFLEGVSVDALAFMPTQSCAAALFIEAKGRMFALTFGYGRALLDAEQIEPMFGLKVVINRVDAERLRSVDVKTFQATQFQIRQQAAGVSPLDTFGLNVRRDVLNAVAGKPTSEDLGTPLAGRDSLTTSIDLASGDITLFCERSWDAFVDTRYKDRFGWIDTIRPVRTTATLDKLDLTLAARISVGTLDGIDLMMPDILDPERISGFKYVGIDDRDELHSDIDIQDMLDAIPDPTVVTVEWLKSKHIKYYDVNETSAIGEWTVYKCLAAQVTLPGETSQFVLSAGAWYEIEQDYVDDVNSQVADSIFLPHSAVQFPDCEDDSMIEEDYNWSTAQILGAYCQDQKLIYLGGQRNKVEPCDIFTLQGQLIHVKRKTRSSSLSHLFAQARVSAELLRREKTFHDKWVKELKSDKEVNGKPFAAVLKWPCKPSTYEVILAIIATNAPRLPEELPFFAKMELVSLVQSLRDVGYLVSFAAIHEEVVKRKKGAKP